MRSFTQFLTESAGVLPVKEDRFNKQLRLRRGYKQIVRMDASKLWDAYAQDNPTFTHLSQAKLDNIRALFDAGTAFDSMPLVTYFKGRVSISDGRHRTFFAAQRHLAIDVGVDVERGSTLPLQLRAK